MGKVKSDYCSQGHLKTKENTRAKMDSRGYVHMACKTCDFERNERAKVLRRLEKPNHPPKRWKGYRWVQRLRMWQASIRIGTRNLHLGSFRDEVDAATAYDEAILKHNKNKCRLNFPMGRPTSKQNDDIPTLVSGSV